MELFLFHANLIEVVLICSNLIDVVKIHRNDSYFI